MVAGIVVHLHVAGLRVRIPLTRKSGAGCLRAGCGNPGRSLSPAAGSAIMSLELDDGVRRVCDKCRGDERCLLRDLCTR
jgi:hypothetical protein